MEHGLSVCHRDGISAQNQIDGAEVDSACALNIFPDFLGVAFRSGPSSSVSQSVSSGSFVAAAAKRNRLAGQKILSDDEKQRTFYLLESLQPSLFVRENHIPAFSVASLQ